MSIDDTAIRVAGDDGQLRRKRWHTDLLQAADAQRNYARAHRSTYDGNPLAGAAANTVMGDSVLAEVRRKGDLLRRCWNPVAEWIRKVLQSS